MSNMKLIFKCNQTAGQQSQLNLVEKCNQLFELEKLLQGSE